MNKKTIIIGVTALVLGGLTILPQTIFAYQGNPAVQGPNYSEERHTIMTQAFENNDYNKWKEQMQGKGRVVEVINESNFSRFAEAHKLAEEGKTDEANKIRQELGLGLGGRGNGSNQRHR
ncbi:MAG: hypothetical protein PHH12_03445 [Candidatus Shapirobacteria bacterium]|jgi:hypothetical protein|nr:hypothetical protein [Candidatus Shapirobacteria bacterium]